MDSFEFNKIAASFLVALLIAMTGSLLSEHIVHPEKLTKPAFVVAGATDSSPQGKGQESDETLKPITPLLASANIERGKEVTKKCMQCHTFDKGGANRIGPNLWGIIGAKIAHRDDFAYSSGFKEKGGNWTVEDLNIYLHKPRSFVANTKMSFVGLKDAQERADVIAYLNTLSDSPKPFPKAGPAKVETKKETKS